MASRPSAILGFRPHTGWAAAVSLARGGKTPVIIDRRRIAYEPQGEATRFVYHKAAEGSLADARGLIDAARVTAQAAAMREINRLIADLDSRRYSVSAAAIPAGNTKLPATLAEILGAHMRIHAAEGAFYRDVLADACEQAGLDVVRTPERDLWPSAANILGIDNDSLKARMSEMGAAVGSPWGEDQKLAALAAWARLEKRK